MHDIAVTRGVTVRVQRNEWRGKPKVDIRTYFGFGDPDSLGPTKKGVSLDIELLPELLAALHDVAARAIEAGELLPEDYENAGLEAPARLRDAA